MNKRTYTASDVAFDALFSSLSMLVLFIFYFLPFNKNLMSAILVIMIACAYQKRDGMSCFIASLVIGALSFLFMDPLIVLFYVLPSLLFGALFRKLIKANKATFYICGFILFIALFFIESFLYTSFYLQENFIEFIARNGIDLSIFGVDQSSDAGRIGTIIGYCVVALIMALCEIIILKESKVYYDERLRFLVERKS